MILLRSRHSRRPVLAGLAALAVLAGALFARDDFWRAPKVETPSFPYSGGFTFARIKFEPTRWGGGPFMWGLDLKWNHDYPDAERNFTRIVEEMTHIDVFTGGGNVLALTDPRLFEHPWAYLCEPGFWNPTEEELANLRLVPVQGRLPGHRRLLRRARLSRAVGELRAADGAASARLRVGSDDHRSPGLPVLFSSRGP